MSWNFGRFGRNFRRLWKIFAFSQLISPVVACIAILTASALGLDTDDIQNKFGESDEHIDNTVDNTLEKLELIHSLVDTGGSKDTCCTLPTFRSCPSMHTPRSQRCEQNTRGQTCSDLQLDCIRCNCDYSCQYGKQSWANCTVLEETDCTGDRNFLRQFTCSYCYLGENPSCSTNLATSCRSSSPDTSRSHWYVANCRASKNTLCLGSPRFSKRLECNWTEGYRWKTALVLSITLGGFGADRFYLGHWQEGIGKLFSFGGLGVWTLVDVVLVSVGYIGPADGSLYI